MSVHFNNGIFTLEMFDGVFLSTEIELEQQAYFSFILLLDKYSNASLFKTSFAARIVTPRRRHLFVH